MKDKLFKILDYTVFIAGIVLVFIWFFGALIGIWNWFGVGYAMLTYFATCGVLFYVFRRGDL